MIISLYIINTGKRLSTRDDLNSIEFRALNQSNSIILASKIDNSACAIYVPGSTKRLRLLKRSYFFRIEANFPALASQSRRARLLQSREKSSIFFVKTKKLSTLAAISVL